MNDLDEWLNSLTPTTEAATPDTPNAVETPNHEQELQQLSQQDFDDILGDFGFAPPEDVQAEEITEEENEEEEEENTNEVRDLDAEEDADWQEAIDSGGVVPVVEPPGIMVDSDGLEYVVDAFNGQRVYLHSVAVDAVNSESGSVIHNILAANRELISSEEPAAPAPQDESALPLNSPTLLLDETTTRFSGAEWYNEIQRKNIIVAGCGGIGSWLVLQLARMHPSSLFMYDDDSVEAVNMAGQLYSRDDIGNSKVSAMSNMIAAYTNMQNVYAINSKFTKNTEAGDIMMCGFDNMKARELFFTSWYNHVQSKPVEERKNCLFLDGRLSMSDLQVFCITGEDDHYMEQYRVKYLFSDEEAEHTVCSMKQTTYLACMIGSIMTNLFTNWVANSLNPIILYDLPFFTEYDSQNMIFKTIK